MGGFSLDLRMHEILRIALEQSRCLISMKRTRAKDTSSLLSGSMYFFGRSFNSMSFTSGERSGPGMLRVEV